MLTLGLAVQRVYAPVPHRGNLIKPGVCACSIWVLLLYLAMTHASRFAQKKEKKKKNVVALALHPINDHVNAKVVLVERKKEKPRR